MILWRVFCLVVLAFLNLPGAAAAFEVQVVTSPKGITAWLVEARGIPIVAMDFSFEGGSSLDAPGKNGSAGLMASLLTEGAADMTAEAFKARTTRLNMALAFNADGDYAEGSLSCLSKNCDESFELLKAAVTKPRFDAEAFERLQQQTLQSIQQRARDQSTIANRLWYAKAFPNHPYGRPVEGTVETVSKLAPQDVKQLHAAMMKRSALRIAVVGDIDAKALAKKLDAVFGDLPLGTPSPKPKRVKTAAGPIQENLGYDGPQTVIVFGNPGLGDDNNETMATHLMAEMLGGGASFARLNQSLRETSGLTYGVYFADLAPRQANYMQGMLSTSNETAGQALQVLQAELSLMAKDGPSPAELRKVKSYVNGSFALRFTSNAAISRTLLAAQQRGRGTDFVERRTQRVNAVTVDEIKAAAAELLKPENRIVVMVGRPK